MHKDKVRKQKQLAGFTIVELLIVIVVIAILAAITIVAYSGIQSKARASAAINDLDSASKVLAGDYVVNSLYPASLSVANNGTGLSSPPNGTIYTYSYNSSANTYCLQGDNGSVSYFITQSTPPTAGGCPGNGTNGQAAITNLDTNPSLETNSTSWGGWAGTSGAGGFSRLTTGAAANGTAYYRLTWTTASTGFSGNIGQTGLPVTAGTQYTVSMSGRSSKSQLLALVMYFYASSDGSGTAMAINTGNSALLAANTWGNFTVSATAPTGANSISTRVSLVSGSGASNWAVGDKLDGDATIVTTGSTTYNYADGNTTNWLWSGAINNSTSTGPQQ